MSQILTSIHGHRLGIDVSGYCTSPKGFAGPEFLLGPNGSEVSQFGLQSATSASTGTAINFGGTLTVNTASTQTFSLKDPLAAGIPMRISGTSTTTGITRTLTLVAATFQTSAGSTASSVAFSVAGSFTLVSLSTALVAINGVGPVTSLTIS